MRETHDPVALAQALADPLRLAILRQLMGGPAAVSELVSATGAAQSNLSNHLALLRERRLVRAERQGRQIIYALRDAHVGELVESLARVAGTPPLAATRKTPAIMRARTCYDHLAGQLGVGLFEALVAREALLAPTPATAAEKPGAAPTAVTLGPAAETIFGALGVSLEEARKSRRRFATACLDWTERRPHLGGALGAALWARAISAGWVLREPGSRAVLVTEAGRAALGERLGLALWPEPAHEGAPIEDPIAEFIGAFSFGVGDLAERHDHYLAEEAHDISRSSSPRSHSARRSER